MFIVLCFYYFFILYQLLGPQCGSLMWQVMVAYFGLLRTLFRLDNIYVYIYIYVYVYFVFFKFRLLFVFYFHFCMWFALCFYLFSKLLLLFICLCSYVLTCVIIVIFVIVFACYLYFHLFCFYYWFMFFSYGAHSAVALCGKSWWPMVAFWGPYSGLSADWTEKNIGKYIKL